MSFVKKLTLRGLFTRILTDVHDTALAQAPDDVHIHHNRGSALARLGHVQASLAQHGEAMQSYEAAILA